MLLTMCEYVIDLIYVTWYIYTTYKNWTWYVFNNYFSLKVPSILFSTYSFISVHLTRQKILEKEKENVLIVRQIVDDLYVAIVDDLYVAIVDDL